MKQHGWVLAAIVGGWLVLRGPATSAAQSPAGEVESVIGRYFKAFYAKDLDGMVALSTPTIEVVDYGQRFTLDEWNWYMEFNFGRGFTYDVNLAEFNTRVHADIAYTSFRMSGVINERGDTNDEIGSAILLRVDGTWRIEYLAMEKRHTWQQWLRDRVDAGQDVSDWYQDYVKDARARAESETRGGVGSPP